MLKSIRMLLVGLNWLNWGLGLLAVIGGVVVAYAMPDRFLHLARQNGVGSPEALLMWMRVVFPLTALVIPLAHIIFTRLVAIIDSIPAGATFSLANAARLQAIGWALLGTQVIDLAFGLYSMQVSEQSGEYLGWSFGFTGWLAVLMLFVLAQVFRDGAAMRADLDGLV
jgi:hypothetical protein